MIPQELSGRQNHAMQIRSQLSNNLFGGFHLKTFKDRAQVTEPKRAIRQSEVQKSTELPGVKEMNDGVSVAEKINYQNRKQSQIAQQLMNVSMKIAVNFEDKYILKETIGEGAHAYVKRALNKQGESFAIKICRSGDPEIVKTFIETYKICRILNFPSILKCHEIYVDEETETLRLVMDYVKYPSLQRLLKQKRKLESNFIRNMMKTLLMTLNHLHERGVAHRDIKPDNILIDPATDGSTLKLIDFGVSAKFKSYQTTRAQLTVSLRDMWTRTGNYLYCAPEIFKGGGYTQLIDIWACGVIMFQSFFGRLPFHEDSIYNTIELIWEAQLNIPEDIDPLARDLLRRLLNSDPNRRVTAEESLKHPWFFSCPESKMKEEQNVLKPLPLLKYKDDRHSQKKNSMFTRNRFARSNTINTDTVDNTENSEELKTPPLDQLMKDLIRSDDDSESDSQSPLMKISKLNRRINGEIHIKRKKRQEFGLDFLESPLVMNLRRIQTQDLIDEEVQEENLGEGEDSDQ